MNEMSLKFPKRVVSAIILTSLAGNIAWATENQYFNVFLYNVIIPEPIYVSLMVAITAVVSAIATIVMGAFSDIKGKRRFYIIYGFVLFALFTALFPFSKFVAPAILGVTVAIILDCIMTWFGCTAYDAAVRAYMVDVSTVKNRGKIVAINEIMVLVGTLIVYAGSGYIIEAFDYYAFFIIIGFLTLVLGVSGALLVEDPPDLKPIDKKVWEHIKSTFSKETIKENKDCFLVILSIGIWAIGWSIFFPFIIIYLQHYVNLDLMTASLVILLAMLVAIILSIPWGKVIDKYGKKKIGIYSLGLECIFLILFAFSNDVIMIIITGIFWVFFMMSWHIASQAWASDLFPEEKAGQFSGYFLFANVLMGMVIGSPIGGLIGQLWGTPVIVDGIPGTAPPPLIFFVAAFVIIGAIFPALMAKEKREQ